MGLFSKRIPKYEWIDVSAALHNEMKNYRVNWFADFVNHVLPLGIGLKSTELTPEIEERIGTLQFAAAATTIRENGYVKLDDFDFFVDAVCLSITSKAMRDLDGLSFEILVGADPKIAVQKWALALLPLVGEAAHNQKLAEVLSQWAMLLVVQSKIQTCEACHDRKGADAIRAIFRS